MVTTTLDNRGGGGAILLALLAIIIVFAVVGFLLGMKKVKSFSTSIEKNENYQPVILKKLNNSSIFVNL